MKKFIKIGLGFFALFSLASLGVLFATRDSRPAIICSSFDDSIRPRDHCLMNPFRNREPEQAAERILAQLKDGNVDVLLPFLNDEGKPRILENEAKYRIKTWRIGHRENTADGVFIMYWVSRENYFNKSTGVDYIENVGFSLIKRASVWEVDRFTTIY